MFPFLFVFFFLSTFATALYSFTICVCVCVCIYIYICTPHLHLHACVHTVCLLSYLCVAFEMCRGGAVCLCACVSLSVTSVRQQSKVKGGVGGATEKRTDENRRRKGDSEAAVGVELELENCFRRRQCVCLSVRVL